MNNTEEFLATFNRIEKWMRQEFGDKTNIGFTQLVRQLSRRKELPLDQYADDLIQMAQLRNAIIHDQIAPDFVIAEPNEWVVKRIIEIEQAVLNPERVIPLFEKNVTGFNEDKPLAELLTIVAQKGYSQFPIYNTRGVCQGLITAHGLGLWLAQHANNSSIDISRQTAKDVLISDRKSQNYRFVTESATLSEVVNLFLTESSLEALLITKDGNPNGKLLGIIRPRDAFGHFYK
ncbi:CBS domain-containing protein [Vagococcus xieshaowenii]|uniref:CBS domain-containing protein n=1 Tax=Vagococcus xieshaowenii TaxID=2562451 RepID=A0AAJ5EDX7_9ENTE|nr:CBS domain-containing protein [Vagococcus xieshaowenii]QCA28585.1 CBS domain-containing protein [Vagococcus xieshaowenii]TFZ40607.1 CBS domain-containing protein [Vagococcus xieshaowenii]